MDIPITLVIKAPNQRVQDQTVECMLGWTVKKLKRHLESVYPSQPKEHNQKLIYSGKLLSDDIQLKDVLRQQEDVSHTVHLVCSSADFGQLESQENSSSVLSNSKCSEESTVPSPNSTPNTSTGEGLRHRVPAHTSSPTTTTSTTQPNYMGGGNPYVQPPQMVMPPGAEMYYTQEQYMMMMQSYYYQMAAAQYMQYYQTGAYPTPPNTPNTPLEEPANQNVENQPPAAGGGDGGGGVMNAQGGMMDDDDDEFGQRDWLDYVHTFARFMVLVSIVYFYSNFTRFLLVSLFFFLVYLYQTGWFTLARRVPENQQEGNEQQPQQNEQEQQNVDQNNTDQMNNNTQQDPNIENEIPAEPDRPGVLAVAWCFVSTLFSSLIPQPPPAVNAN